MDEVFGLFPIPFMRARHAGAAAGHTAGRGLHDAGGLVHGLGFAGALKDIGLPQRHLPLALFCFNLGVEIGQLAMVAVAFAVLNRRFARRRLGVARRPAL